MHTKVNYKKWNQILILGPVLWKLQNNTSDYAKL